MVNKPPGPGRDLPRSEPIGNRSTATAVDAQNAQIMSPDDVAYEYYSNAEWEAMWIEEHGRHMVGAGTANWLVCRTCSSVLHVTTQPSFEVLKTFRP